jgi:hypothetical protein
MEGFSWLVVDLAFNERNQGSDAKLTVRLRSLAKPTVRLRRVAKPTLWLNVYNRPQAAIASEPL